MAELLHQAQASAVAPPQGAAPKQRQRQPRPQQQIDVPAESRRLADEAAAAAQNPRLATMRAARSKLPAAAAKDDVLQRLRQHQVIVISGATGVLSRTEINPKAMLGPFHKNCKSSNRHL